MCTLQHWRSSTGPRRSTGASLQHHGLLLHNADVLHRSTAAGFCVAELSCEGFRQSVMVEKSEANQSLQMKMGIWEEKELPTGSHGRIEGQG